ncbi:hypothetical protein [Schleiferilactobacillus perolens]|jgi:hypothetical protein|nr:hypothetical protein [Schleiferilactobacillus perolens]
MKVMTWLKKLLSSIGVLVLINLVVLFLITGWAASYTFGPAIFGGSTKHAMDQFVRTELIIGGGFVVLFNGYVLYRTVTGKNREYNKRLAEKKNQRNKKK